MECRVKPGNDVWEYLVSRARYSALALLRRIGTHVSFNEDGPGSAAHHAAKGGCAGGTVLHCDDGEAFTRLKRSTSESAAATLP